MNRAAAAAVAVGLLGGAAGAGPPADHAQLFAGRWVHAPVADDDCGVCHSIHGPAGGPQLQAAVPELCYQCHEDVAAQDVVHEPVGQGRCTDCHRVHTSDARPLLVSPVPDLCIGCHQPDERHVARSNVCVSCHGVHSSATARFLKGDRARNCGTCHGDKRVGESRHAPAREGKCLSCHFTHPDPRFATQRFRAAYPLAFRGAYRPGDYALCDKCHPPGLYADPAFAETGFRTATTNLHARHVVGEEAVTCSACHDLHAASRPALMVDRVRPPGRTPRLMQFLRFSTGGTCGPACHASATYLREADAAEFAEDWE